MRFLFRLTFWLGLVLLLLPRAGSHSASDIGVIEAVSAAKSTVSDMRGFCERQPVACAVGTQTAIALGQRAQEYEEIGHPDDGEPKIRVPLGLGVFLALRDPK